MHLLSPDGLTSTAIDFDSGWEIGPRVRAKRRAQAEFVARLVQTLQTANPREPLLVLGDFEAPLVSDGYVDVIGTISGTPTPPDKVVLPSEDLVQPDLFDLVQLLPPAEQYSVVIDGTAQPLDHALANATMRPWIGRVGYGRSNADFPDVAAYRGDPNRPERLSDHDALVVSMGLGTPKLKVLVSNVSDPGLAVVQLQNTGGAMARDVTIEQVTVFLVSGSGTLDYAGPKPFPVGEIPVSDSRVVQLPLATTGTVDMFFLSLSFSYLDASGVRSRTRAGVMVTR